VDIFAARHTPVLAPSNASVTRVGEGEVGGRYVWLYDSKRSMYLYFAHLETREEERGDQIRDGQRIGTVGNTGNARFTPPHLHFGIYRNGPIDPFRFIAETDTVPEKITGDTLLLGKIVRAIRPSVLRSSPTTAGMFTDTLQTDSMMTVTALTGIYAGCNCSMALRGILKGGLISVFGQCFFNFLDIPLKIRIVNSPGFPCLIQDFHGLGIIPLLK